MSLPELQFREASVADVQQAYDYLQEQSTLALADRFLMSLERTVQQIRRYPAAGSLVRSQRALLVGLRWRQWQNFPAI